MKTPTEKIKEIERMIKKKIEEASDVELAEAKGFLDGLKLGKEAREKEIEKLIDNRIKITKRNYEFTKPPKELDNLNIFKSKIDELEIIKSQLQQKEKK